MSLSRFERKARLRHGDVGRVAAECGCSVAYASEVLSDKGGATPLARKVQLAFARRMKVRVAEAFGDATVPPAPALPSDASEPSEASEGTEGAARHKSDLAA